MNVGRIRYFRDLHYNECMAKVSAGLLLYRRHDNIMEVFLVHPGGPFWAKKDAGAWSIPKGLIDLGEEPLCAAQREFEEETGFTRAGEFIPLAPVKVASGKTIQAWAVEGDCDPDALKSNTFEMEWPPRSGKKQQFPEVDRGGWFNLDEAKEKINKGQVPFIEELKEKAR